MSHETHISHTDLQSTHRGLAETGTSRLEDVRALRAYLEGEGNPWGDDEMGSLIGSAYLAVTRHALEVYESLAERHVTTSGDVEFMASNYLSAEQGSEEAADRIMRAVQRP